MRQGREFVLTVSIAQWLERRPPNLAVVGSSPGGDRHIYVPVMLRSSYLLTNKAMPGTSLKKTKKKTKKKHVREPQFETRQGRRIL